MDTTGPETTQDPRPITVTVTGAAGEPGDGTGPRFEFDEDAGESDGETTTLEQSTLRTDFANPTRPRLRPGDYFSVEGRLYAVQNSSQDGWVRFEPPARQAIPAGAVLQTDAPVILIANEVLDCLPARQFIKTEGGWAERRIGVSWKAELREDALKLTATSEEGISVEVALPGVGRRP